MKNKILLLTIYMLLILPKTQATQNFNVDQASWQLNLSNIFSVFQETTLKKIIVAGTPFALFKRRELTNLLSDDYIDNLNQEIYDQKVHLMLENNLSTIIGNATYMSCALLLTIRFNDPLKDNLMMHLSPNHLNVTRLNNLMTQVACDQHFDGLTSLFKKLNDIHCFDMIQQNTLCQTLAIAARSAQIDLIVKILVNKKIKIESNDDQLMVKQAIQWLNVPTTRAVSNKHTNEFAINLLTELIPPFILSPSAPLLPIKAYRQHYFPYQNLANQLLGIVHTNVESVFIACGICVVSGFAYALYNEYNT